MTTPEIASSYGPDVVNVAVLVSVLAGRVAVAGRMVTLSGAETPGRIS